MAASADAHEKGARVMDSDFKVMHECAGRRWMHPMVRTFRDLVCTLIGHNLWRVMGSVTRPDDATLDCHASYCRRCFKGGYVQGD